MKFAKRLLVTVGALTLAAGLNFAAGDAAADSGSLRADWHCC